MPTDITNPPQGVKHSESPTATDLTGVLVLALRPKNGGGVENANVPVEELAGPVRDIYGATQAKAQQVFGFFTSPTQRTAVDQPLTGDTSTGLGSRIPDVPNGDVYELVPDAANPMPDPNNAGQTIATPTWIRYGL